MPRFLIALLFFTVSFVATTVSAAPIPAKAVFVSGPSKVFPADGGPAKNIIEGSSFTAGDRIRTSVNGVVEIKIGTGALIRIDRDTSMTIQELSRDQSGNTRSIFGLLFGRVRSAVTRMATKLSKFEYHTKAAICGVAGTEWVTEFNRKSNVATVDVIKKPPGARPSRLYLKGTDAGKTKRWITGGESLTARLGQRPGLARATSAARSRQLNRNIPFSTPAPETEGSSGQGAAEQTSDEPVGDDEPAGASDVGTSGEGASAIGSGTAQTVSINQITRKISLPRQAAPSEVNSVSSADSQGTQNQGIIGESATSSGDAALPVTSANINIQINLK